MRYSDKASDIGTKLGPKLVSLISDTIAATKLKLLDTEHRARVHSMQTVIDRAGAEIADLYRPVLQEVMKDLDLPSELQDFLDKTLSGKHQWQAVAGMGLYASGAPSALTTILSNFLAPGVRFAVGKDPQLLPANELLIELGVKGAMDWNDVNTYAHGAGYADFTIQAIAEGARSYPALAETLELLRRKQISQQEASLSLTRNGVPASLHAPLLSLAHTPLTPADLADMVVRGIKAQHEAAAIAAESGVDASDFDALVLDTGEPPATQQLNEAYRRGFIDRARLVRGIRQSRTRDEWVDVIEKLRYSPMSVADAVNAVVQNHISMAEGEKFADYNGLEPGMFHILFETAGEPLSRTEMEQLYNRGLVSESDVKQALRESRLKDKYIDAAFRLHTRLIPPRELAAAVHSGALSHANAVKKAMEYGYSAEDAKILTVSGSARKIDPWKREVVTSVAGLYEENAVTASHAESVIKDMGYAEAEAKFILQAAEFRREARTLTTAISAVRSKYLGRHITEHTASGLLDQIGLPSERRDYLLRLWAIDRSAAVRSLTEAQVIRAMKKQHITPDDALARLVAMGYSAGDADLLIKDA